MRAIIFFQTLYWVAVVVRRKYVSVSSLGINEPSNSLFKILSDAVIHLEESAIEAFAGIFMGLGESL